jgi:hypothetical protein
MKIAFAALMSLVLSVPATAGEIEILAAQDTVSGQIEAFRAGDNARAYSFAAPNVVQVFPTLDRFMTMVESGYKPVQKPSSFAMGRVKELDASTVVQEVLLVGPDGKDYAATYIVARQSDGSWQITAVSLKQASSLST